MYWHAACRRSPSTNIKVPIFRSRLGFPKSDTEGFQCARLPRCSHANLKHLAAIAGPVLDAMYGAVPFFMGEKFFVGNQLFSRMLAQYLDV